MFNPTNLQTNMKSLEKDKFHALAEEMLYINL